MKARLSNITVKTCLYIFFFTFFLLPSLINIKNSHSWGDDFAHYIHQAINLVRQKKIEDVGLIFDKNTLNWGAPLYVPMGFPLLLSVSYYFFGNSIFHFNILMSFLYFLFGIALYTYLKNKTQNILLSLLLTGLTIYNPWLLSFKSAILTDLPFVLFLLISLNILEKYNPKKKFIIKTSIVTCILGFTFTIRPIWPTLAVSVFLYSIIHTITKRKITKTSLGYFIISLTSTLFNFFIHRYLFNIQGSPGYYSSSYSIIKNIDLMKSIYAIKSILGTIKSTIFIPIQLSTNYIDIIYIIIIISITIGFLIKILSKIEITEIFTIIYLLLLFFLKRDDRQGFRYLLPFIPSFLLYIATILSKIKNKYFLNILLTFVFIFSLLSYYHPIKNIIAQTNTVLEGPQIPIVKETFFYILKNIPDKSIIIFRKPLALSLYTNKKSHPILAIQITDQSILDYAEKEYSKIGTNYFLHDIENKSFEEQELLYKFIQQTKRVKLIYNNERFELYKYNSN